MEYRQILDWVNKEDWSALLDVVPFMFLPLGIYVVVMLLSNALLVRFINKKSGNCSGGAAQIKILPIDRIGRSIIMKENRKLLKEVLKDIRHDMTDEEVLNLLADSKISVSPEKEKEKYTLGQRAADTIAKFAGSWAFIFSFTGGLILWMVINTILASKAFDAYPFILLNLVLSCVAAIQAPLIMMSQNRQEEKDRRRAENDYKVNLKTEIMIEDLHDKVNAILIRQSQIEKVLSEQKEKNTL